jgi:hypothetical protein
LGTLSVPDQEYSINALCALLYCYILLRSLGRNHYWSTNSPRWYNPAVVSDSSLIVVYKIF